MSYSLPKGTFDIIPIETEDSWKASSRWLHLERIMREISHTYSFREIRTPIFEKTELFTRVVGETSDIVTKEMYTFFDKANRSMSLRPEGTAPTIRALIENGLCQTGKLQKVYYIGPFFRYDRPQAGRFRQFHQFGAEVIGNANPECDVEMIDMLMNLYSRLGIKNLKIQVNSVGNQTSRDVYGSALKDYLKKHFDSLTPESQLRFEKNPLRILDTKDAAEKELLKHAPNILNYLDKESNDHFQRVLSLLKLLNLSYTVDPSLVRGLDYYNNTVFEIASTNLGAQNTIGAGGRYDGLMKTLGGPDLPSIGFATGIERILLTMQDQNCSFGNTPKPFVIYLPLDEESKNTASLLIAQTRRNNLPADMLISTKKMHKALSDVENSGTELCIIIGEQERINQSVQLKFMTKRESVIVSQDSLQDYLLELWKQYQAFA